MSIIILIVLSVFLNSGCTRHEETYSALDQKATVTQSGSKTSVKIQGPGGKDAYVAESSEVTQLIGLPVYPGAELDRSSQYIARNKATGEKSITVKYHCKDSFDRVCKWYLGKMKVKPQRTELFGSKYMLINKPEADDTGTRNALISQKGKDGLIQISLLRVIRGKDQ